MLHDAKLRANGPPSGIERVAAIAAEHADAVDREGRAPLEAIAAMREEGLLGACVPVSLGGQGASFRTLARQTQTLAQACAATAMVYAMHHSQLACVVAHALDTPWHRDFARRVAAEQLLIASITSEVGIGGDMRSSKCALAVEGDRFSVTKEAPTVSYGAHADVFLVTCRAGADAPPSDQVMVTVMRDGAVHGEQSRWDSLGLRGTSSGGFSFTGTGHVDQIAPVPFAVIAAETMVPTSHFLWGAAWTGIAAEALTRARAFLRAAARKAPGKTPPGAVRLMRGIGLLEAGQARLAAMIDSYDACTVFGTGGEAGEAPAAGWPQDMAHVTALNTLKRDLSEKCHEAVLEALLICGMAGYRNDTEFSVGRHLRDILGGQLMISNDRIAATTGSLLLAQRTPLGSL